MVVNYGLDSVRFIQPVKVDSRVRLKVKLGEVTEKNRHGCSRRLPRWRSRVACLYSRVAVALFV
jgi:acyl dehydratase